MSDIELALLQFSSRDGKQFKLSPRNIMGELATLHRAIYLAKTTDPWAPTLRGNACPVPQKCPPPLPKIAGSLFYTEKKGASPNHRYWIFFLGPRGAIKSHGAAILFFETERGESFIFV